MPRRTNAWRTNASMDKCQYRHLSYKAFVFRGICLLTGHAFDPTDRHSGFRRSGFGRSGFRHTGFGVKVNTNPKRPKMDPACQKKPNPKRQETPELRTSENPKPRLSKTKPSGRCSCCWSCCCWSCVQTLNYCYLPKICIFSFE